MVLCTVQGDVSCWTSREELESRLAELQCRYDELVVKNKTTVTQLETEVKSLRQQVRRQADEMAWLRGGTTAGHSVTDLLKRLRTEHDALLHRQLDDIRAECLRVEPVVNSSQSVELDDELTASCLQHDADTQPDSMCTAIDVVVSQKRQLSPSFDLSCTTSDDEHLAKRTKLF